MYILAAAPPDNRDEEEEEKIHDTVTPELSQQRSQTYDRQTHSWEELWRKWNPKGLWKSYLGKK